MRVFSSWVTRLYWSYFINNVRDLGVQLDNELSMKKPHQHPDIEGRETFYWMLHWLFITLHVLLVPLVTNTYMRWCITVYHQRLYWHAYRRPQKQVVRSMTHFSNWGQEMPLNPTFSTHKLNFTIEFVLKHNDKSKLSAFWHSCKLFCAIVAICLFEI